MAAANPRVVLRNWLAQRAIERADAGDFAEVAALLRELQSPFDDGEQRFEGCAPPHANDPLVSCSS